MRKMVIIAAGVAVLGAPVGVFGTGFGSVGSSFKARSVRYICLLRPRRVAYDDDGVGYKLSSS